MSKNNNAKKITKEIERQLGITVGGRSVEGLPTDKKELTERIAAAITKRKAAKKPEEKKITLKDTVEVLKGAVSEMAEVTNQNADIVKSLAESMIALANVYTAKEAPAWYKHAPESVEIKNETLKVDTGLVIPEPRDFPNEFSINNFPDAAEPMEFPKGFEITNEKAISVKVENQKDDADIIETMAFLFKEMVRFFTGAFKKIFRVRLEADHYRTPQMVVLYDSKTRKPAKLEELGFGAMNISNFVGGSGGPSSVAIRGANGVGDMTATLAASGTRQQLTNQVCSRVYVQASMENTGEIVIGGSTVVAAAGSRRGLMLSSTQWAEFKIDNLNRLWIDGTATNDKITLLYEA